MAHSPEDAPIDYSLEAMAERLSGLQESLGAVVSKAQILFDGAFNFVPHPACVDEDFPIRGVKAMNAHSGGEITVRLDGEEWIKVFSSPDYGPSWPNLRIWHDMPEGDVRRRVNITGWLNASLKYDLKVSDLDDNRYQGFVGYGYVNQESFIDGVDKALGSADLIINRSLDFTEDAAIRIRQQRMEINSGAYGRLPLVEIDEV